MFSQQQSSAVDGLLSGRIAIDEHSTASCIVHDVTSTGLRLTLLDGSIVPATFVLFVEGNVRVCRIVERAEEELRATFADEKPVGRAVGVNARSADRGHRFGRDAAFKLAA